jgi:signal transduction histidine kinase
MEDRRRIAADRAHTDESLGEERAKVDWSSEVRSPALQRSMDDAIERGRTLVDHKLCTLRDRVDAHLASNRLALPNDTISVALERQLADESTKAERATTDALVGRERQRTDAAREADRREHDSDRHAMEARRQETDEQLSLERKDADAAVIALTESKAALAQASGGPSPRGDVLAMVSHDLRSPLAVITMNAEMIARCVNDPEALASVKEVSCASARMTRMLADLLDAARIEIGALRIVKREHDVCAFLAEVHRSYRPLFEDRGITFTVDLPPHPIFASFDHDRVVQVLSNLLGNALKFTPAKGTVSVYVARRGEEIEFGLRNSGPGIPPDELPNVFKRFWHVDSTTRRGLGLGLHICEKIVAEHGGRIWVESELGNGAIFRFTLAPDSERAGGAVGR